MAPEREFFCCMSKIKEYYLNKASYIAVDDSGKRFDVEVNYWGNSYKISQKNSDLEIFVKKILKRKHKVNFVHKMIEK